MALVGVLISVSGPGFGFMSPGERWQMSYYNMIQDTSKM